MSRILKSLIFLTCLIQAQYRYGTTAANFLEIGVSSRAVAMGHAYVSLADDAISAYWNPAGLSKVQGLEFGFSSQDWVVGIQHSSFAIAANMGNYGTLSAWFTDFDYGSIEVTNITNQEGTGENYNANELAASLAYGRNLVDWFSFGASVKMINSTIWHSSAKAMALDLGVIVKTDFFSRTGNRNDGMNIGMSISNYGSRMRYDGIDLINPIDIAENENGNYDYVIGQFRTESWELPLIFRLGASFKPIVKSFHNLILSFDVLHPNNNSESINLGTEYNFNAVGGNKLSVRGGVKGLGISQGHKTESILNEEIPFSSLTFGLGFERIISKNRTVGIDYSFQTIGLLGDVSLLTIRLNLL